jgi:hypothetical protein
MNTGAKNTGINNTGANNTGTNNIGTNSCAITDRPREITIPAVSCVYRTLIYFASRFISIKFIFKSCLEEYRCAYPSVKFCGC